MRIPLEQIANEAGVTLRKAQYDSQHNKLNQRDLGSIAAYIIGERLRREA